MKLGWLFLVVLSLVISGCGGNNEETVVSPSGKEEAGSEESKQYIAYESAVKYITQLFSQGNPDIINHDTYENSLVIKREDGFYLVTSSFRTNTTSGSELYNYEMLLNGDYEILDAYVPGSIGVLDRPMVYDQLGQSAISNLLGGNDEENSPDAGKDDSISTDSQEDNSAEINEEQMDDENEQIIDDIYGDESEDSSENEEPGSSQDQEGTSSLQEDKDDEIQWDKVEGLEATLQDISDLLNQVQSINSDALSLDLNEKSAQDTIEVLNTEKDKLNSILRDSETKNNLGDNGTNDIEGIISSLEEVVEIEEQVLSDPMSTHNIRVAESVVDDAMFNIDVLITSK
ncbi:hypothetical protein [Guptibacillus spartinae]|uniref:hypothetical protein n=1 Tax=Guptibacillus spartinae TaxID=3025679 RepID=UPI00235F754D|nr:hypothetical protein [Pseudalkalibacillus spartinae]